MSELSAAERAYQRLKADILKGTIPVGTIDIRTLSDRLRMSVTPVRDALARLSAERLVKLSPHHGYAVASPSARRLEHLYELAGILTDLCLERASTTGWGQPAKAKGIAVQTGYAELMTAVVRDIATAQTNLELAEHLFAISDRLFTARRREPELFEDASGEAEALARLWEKRSYRTLRLRLRAHHALRLDRVDALARLLTDPAGDP